MPNVSAMRLMGWTNPGVPKSDTERKWKEANLVKATGVPVVKTLWVNKEVVLIFNALNVVLQETGARLGQHVDDWGFANRDIRGFAGQKSYHSWGLAEDLDATENPMGERATTFPTWRTHRVCKLLGLKWGYDYTKRPDPMHFEFTQSKIRARFISKRLTHSTKRTRALAKLAWTPCRRVC
jgi:hypothetical protein